MYSKPLFLSQNPSKPYNSLLPGLFQRLPAFFRVFTNPFMQVIWLIVALAASAFFTAFACVDFVLTLVSEINQFQCFFKRQVSTFFQRNSRLFKIFFRNSGFCLVRFAPLKTCCTYNIYYSRIFYSIQDGLGNLLVYVISFLSSASISKASSQ